MAIAQIDSWKHATRTVRKQRATTQLRNRPENNSPRLIRAIAVRQFRAVPWKIILNNVFSRAQCFLNQKTREGCGCFRGPCRSFWRKVPGKVRENCWKIFLESPNATNSRISGTGKGKPARNLGSTLPGPCPHLPCGVFFEIDSSSLLEFF